MATTIRAVKAEDINSIIELTGEIARHEQASFDPIGKAEKLSKYLFSDAPRIYCLVAENEKSIIGYITYSIEFSVFQADNYLRINTFDVKEPFRGQGVGCAIIAEIKREAKRLGCDCIRFFTPAFNIDAINFYKSLGAKTTDSVRFYLLVE